jgi:hypothetical protein
MGTAQTVFVGVPEVIACAGATGSCITGYDVTGSCITGNDITGNDVLFVPRF